jgi:hypothetical protein
MGQLSDDSAKDAAIKAFMARYHDPTQHVPRPPQVYEHYKGGIYVVTAVGLNEKTLEPMVAYWSNLKETGWFRTLENFEEEVGINQRQRPRFLRLAH